MLEIQKLLPFIEIIHHPITKDYRTWIYKPIINCLYRFSRDRWYSFLKMQKKVAPNIKNIITPSLNSLKDIARDFKCNQQHDYCYSQWS